MDDTLKIEVTGQAFTGFKSVSVKRSMDNLVGSFDISFARKSQAGQNPFIAREGDYIDIFAGEDKIMTGIIDKFKPSISNEISYSITGRDLTADLVDSSAIYKTGCWKNVTADWIIHDLITPFDITFINPELISMVPVKEFSIQSGETVFTAIDRLLRGLAFLQSTNPAGELLLLSDKREQAGSGLKEGVNIKTGAAEYSLVERFQKYIVKAEPKTDGNPWVGSVSAIKGEAVDEDIRRYRVLQINGEQAMTRQAAEKRAKWERATRMARGFTADFTVQGWRDGRGKLWEINTLTTVHAPSLDIYNSKLLIKEVEYSQDDNGTETSLTLCPENAYLPEEKKQKKPGKGKANPFL